MEATTDFLNPRYIHWQPDGWFSIPQGFRGIRPKKYILERILHLKMISLWIDIGWGMSSDSERNTTKTDLAGRGKKTKPSTSRAPAKPSCLKLSAYKIHKIQHLVHSTTCVLYIMLRVCNGGGVVFCSQQHTAHNTQHCECSSIGGE